jgi:diguanylate cyclase (GGDEF)-like protein/PAS domain S-box-containing protein
MTESQALLDGVTAPHPHPRTLGWIGTTALAMGGSNQSLFLLSALVANQGSAAVPLLIVGLLLSYAAAFGWTELVLMFPDRVGGIAASCAEAFRPYSPVLSTLTGVCYWWGWVPTCGLTAILSASAITQWYLPDVPVPPVAIGLVLLFTLVNLAGVRWVTRLAVPIAIISAGLALVSGMAPVLAGSVDWQLASSFHLVSPFPGLFGDLTSAMAGLYLIGFAAPAFEAAACHVGETVDPNRNVPRAMLASGAMAAVYFVLVPVVWLGVLGPETLQQDLAQVLGPTFAPVFGSTARAAAIGFMMLNMFHGTLQPLAGASRTLMQLAEDGLLPRLLALRSRADVPWVATLLTAGPAIAFLLAGDPTWLIAAANLAYLIGIGLPSVAVWLLRRDAPHLLRPYRAPRGTIQLGLVAAGAWGVSCLLGFQQFGLPTVIVGLALCYSGAGLYAIRRWSDSRRAGRSGVTVSLHLKLTGAMLLVLALDGAGYLLAVEYVDHEQAALVTGLEDIFVAVALLTVTVGLVLPGMIAHAAEEVARAADRLATGTLADLVRAIQALGVGDLDAAHARVDVVPVVVHSGDELGAMAASFNIMQDNVACAAIALDGAREGLRHARTDLEASHATLRASEERFRSLVQNASDVIVIVQANGSITYVSPAAERVWGHAPDKLRGTAALALVHPDDRAAAQLHLDDALLQPGLNVNTELRLGHADGTWRDCEVVASNLLDHPAVAGLVVTYRDVTERKLFEQQLTRLAFHDQLSGLPNRALFLDRLEHALGSASREHLQVAVLFVDLDNFKVVNDSLGHEAGDQLLVEVANRLQVCLRAGDTVARLGGDEFTLLLEEVAHEDAATLAAERIAEVLRTPIRLNERDVVISASIGIALSGARRDRPEDLLRNADLAMYQAKASGKGRHAMFDLGMNRRALERMELETDLRHALERGQLRVYYQPIVCLATGRTEEVEALVRWEHPQRGLVMPLEFIPIAEETGLIVPIGQWVLEEACRQTSTWQAGVPEAHSMVVSVNLSARQFKHPQLAADIALAVRTTGLDPCRLKLEITESVVMDNAETAVATLHGLKALGIQLAIDDFGTGYSSLSALKRFPVDTLKIDRSFVDGIGQDAQDTAIVRSVVSLAKILGLRVTAEGIETAAQAAKLTALGCEQGQGYLFARPMPAERLPAYLAAEGGRDFLARAA